MRDEILYQLEEQAQYFEQKARKLRRRAKERKNTLRKRHEFHKLINNISGDVDPIAYASKHNLPLETVLSWHKRALDKKKAATLEVRNREIRRLANVGLTNRQIALKFDLHPNSISRVLNQQRRELVPRQLESFYRVFHQED